MYFQDFWVKTERLVKESIIMNSGYQAGNREHGRIYAQMHNLAAELTGNTGGWNARRINFELED